MRTSHYTIEDYERYAGDCRVIACNLRTNNAALDHLSQSERANVDRLIEELHSIAEDLDELAGNG